MRYNDAFIYDVQLFKLHKAVFNINCKEFVLLCNVPVYMTFRFDFII